MKLNLFKRNSQPINLAITPDTLESLIQNGSLHAADFSCLDLASKASVWRILLSNTSRHNAVSSR